MIKFFSVILMLCITFSVSADQTSDGSEVTCRMFDFGGQWSYQGDLLTMVQGDDCTVIMDSDFYGPWQISIGADYQVSVTVNDIEYMGLFHKTPLTRNLQDQLVPTSIEWVSGTTWKRIDSLSAKSLSQVALP